MRVLNIFLILIFVVAAALQYNDPDPYIWVPIYLYAAVICSLALRNIYHQKYYIIGLLVYLSYAVYLFFDTNGVLNWMAVHNSENLVQSMEATKPWIEETREFGGLLICVIAFVINMIWFRKKKDRKLINL